MTIFKSRAFAKVRAGGAAPATACSKRSLTSASLVGVLSLALQTASPHLARAELAPGATPLHLALVKMMLSDEMGFGCAVSFLQQRALPQEPECEPYANEMLFRMRVQNIDPRNEEAIKSIENAVIRDLVDIIKRNSTPK